MSQKQNKQDKSDSAYYIQQDVSPGLGGPAAPMQRRGALLVHTFVERVDVTLGLLSRGFRQAGQLGD